MPTSHPESTALSLENPGASKGKSHDAPAAVIPTIVISHIDSAPELPEEEKPDKEPLSANENSPQDKAEDSDNPLTSHFKMIFRGLSRSRSQESLVSTKSNGDDDLPDLDSMQRCSQNGGVHGESTEGPSRLHFSARSNKKEKICFKLSGGAHKAKGKDQGTLPRGEDSQCQKSQVNWEQLEATKAIFDLLKEISGLSSIHIQEGDFCDSFKSLKIIPVVSCSAGNQLEIWCSLLPTFLKLTRCSTSDCLTYFHKSLDRLFYFFPLF